MARRWFGACALLGLALASACSTDQAGNSVKSVGDSMAGAARGAVSLVNVDLSNVLNKVAVDLKIDKANVPINAQIPISLAANICGVSINILSASGGGSPNCTAKSTNPELEQAVQQQLAANGSVGGGSQSTSSATPAPTASPTASPAPAATATPTGSNTISAPVTSNVTKG